MKIPVITSMGIVLLLLASPAFAVSVTVYWEDRPQCDALELPFPEFDECGWAPTFPYGEVITSEYLYETPLSACPMTDDPSIPNVLIEMTNKSCCPWGRSPIWYVADPETTITNFDGVIGNAGLGDAEEAFRIDSIGLNTPLIFESMTQDNLFEVGETWHFILQDYSNALGGPPHQYDSIGIASRSTGWPPSTGSIIQPIPEPLTVLGVFLGVCSLGRYIRRRRLA